MRTVKLTKEGQKFDREFDLAWGQLASGVQVDIMDLSRIVTDVKLAMAAGASLKDAILSVVPKYRKN